MTPPIVVSQEQRETIERAIGRRSAPAAPPAPPRTPLREKRRAHFIGAVCATLAVIVCLWLAATESRTELAWVFLVSPLAFLAGWGLSRLYSWYENTPPDAH